MKKAGKVLAVVLLMSIAFHMYYDVTAQLNLARDVQKKELSVQNYSSKSLRIGFHTFILHVHDFVIHSTFGYSTQANEFTINQYFAPCRFLPFSNSSFWHPPQA